MALISEPCLATADSELLKIENQLAHAEYRKAREIITNLLNQKEVALEIRTKLYWLNALCHISENQVTLAKASFSKLFATNPRFKPLENTSPKILDIFNEALEEFKKQIGLAQSIGSVFAPLEGAIAGQPTVFQVKIDDSSSQKKLAKLEFHIRRLGNSEYSSLDFKKLNTDSSIFEVTIPRVLTMHLESDATFEYFIGFFATDGSYLGGIGKNTLPLTFEVSAKSKDLRESSSDNSQKGFISATIWVSAAAITVAGLVALAFSFSTPQEGGLRIKVFPSE